MDVHGLTRIIAILTRERLSEWEAEINHFHWIQTEKDNAMAKCRLGLRAWRSKKPMLCLHVTDEDGHPQENEDESGRRSCELWSTIFQGRSEDGKHHRLGTILNCVQKALDNIRWEIGWNEFDELMATKSLLRALMEFHIASIGVREAWVLGVSPTPFNMSLKVSPNPPSSTTMDGS